jgi:hypothetical protein
MIPILATSAVSIANEIYDDIATKSASSSAQSATKPADGVNFSTLLNHAGASHSAGGTQSLQQAADLFSQLTKGSDMEAAFKSFGA